ncbi:MAG: tetrathionate reductase family octaheme c-type cytochrome, partial [Calditrichaeota bacterium]|nr:tetrathionate reductase family octaheme c-type cytochrome [Calditrichota bacterium]
MPKTRLKWMMIVLLVLVVLIVPLIIFAPKAKVQQDDPWLYMPKKVSHTDHAPLLQGPFADGPSVTKKCLECHPAAGKEMLHNVHWTWLGKPVLLPGRKDSVRMGKKVSLNNFCIGIRGNWPPCTACHAGYGWSDANFDFSNENNIDCLVCHDHSGQYVKGKSGIPPKDVDLVAAAKSVGRPTRLNCGSCHFTGGGGDAVKHGDLDRSLDFPPERVDVHMGKYNLVCVDCHKGEHHEIRGRLMSVSADDENQAYCTDCHLEKPHKDERLNAHTDAVACQTCHIPEAAVKEATKVEWDWSEAGKNLPENPHEYLKIKGSFVYEKGLRPEYHWFNGKSDHYLLGDKIDPNKTTLLNRPLGDINDPKAKIFPFKVHHAKQIYDKKYNYLLVPKTYGKGGYWTEFNWQKAAKLGSEANGIKYSGEYGFARTDMFWPLSHMVAPKEKA